MKTILCLLLLFSFQVVICQQPGTKKWEFQTGGSIESSPALGSLAILIGSTDHYIYWVRSDGSYFGKTGTNGEVYSSPAALNNYWREQRFCCGSNDSSLYFMIEESADDILSYSHYVGNIVQSTPAVGSDGTIYFGSWDSKFYAEIPWSGSKWEFQTGAGISSSTAVGNEGDGGTIYFGSWDHKLYALNPDGIEKWAFTTGGAIKSSPAIGSDGTIYVGSNDNKLYAINNDGTKRWEFLTSGIVRSSPAIGEDGTIYVGSLDNNIYAINPNGTKRWEFTTDNEVHSSPAIGKDGTVFIGSNDSSLYAINSDGTLKWKFLTGGVVKSSPTIDSDGTIYFGAGDGKLYAVSSDCGGLANSPWPKFMRNKFNNASSPDVPNDPTNLSLSEVTFNSITLSWEDNSTINTNYFVERKTGSGGEWEIVGWRLGANTTTYKDTNLTDNTEYCYRVRAYNWIGDAYSDYTNEKCAITQECGKIKWEFQTSGTIYSCPAIGDDRTIYFGSTDYKLYALDSNGTEKWKFLTDGEVRSSPAIGDEGTIYVGSEDYKLYAINSDGTKKWEFMTGASIESSPAIGRNGIVYIGSNDNNLYAINSDGTQKWEFITGDKIISSPAIGAEGTIYVGSNDNKLYAINQDGTKNWEFLIGGGIETSPAIGKGEIVYVCSGGVLYAINPDGTQMWKREFTFLGYSFDLSSPVIGSNGRIYLNAYWYGAEDPDLGYIFEVSNNGDLSFERRTYVSPASYSYITSPIVGYNGTIYINSYRENLIAFEKVWGDKKWESYYSTNFSSSHAMDEEGTIYVGGLDGKLYAILTDSEGLAASPWPKFRKNRKNNGANDALPIALVAEDFISIPKAETITLDASPSYDPYGSTLTFLWQIEDQPSGSSIVLTDSTSASIQVSIPSIRGGYLFSVEVKNIDGHSAYAEVYASTEIKWESSITGVSTSQAIGKDGTLYFGTSDSILYAFQPDGTKKWEFSSEAGIHSFPVIGNEGTIYFGSENGCLYALNEDGSKKWEYITGGYSYSSPAIGNDGTIYFGSSGISGRFIYAINSNGNKIWEFATSGANTSPVIGSDGTIYFGSTDSYITSKIYALYPNGSLKWEFVTGWGNVGSPAIGLDGTIYVVTEDDKLYAINPDGTKKWEFIAKRYLSSPLIGADGTIYYGNYSINQDGTKKYEFLEECAYLEEVEISAIGDDGTLYFKSLYGLYALDYNGNLKWDFNFDRTLGTWHGNRPSIHGLSVGIDGSIYIGAHGGIFFDNERYYALICDSKGVANAPWPKFGGNQFNNGVTHYLFTDFYADTTLGDPPFTVHFQDSSQGNIFNWFWDFGDSTASTEQNPVHLYEEIGSYSVSLITANPSRSDTIIKNDYIIVGDPASISDYPIPEEFCLFSNYPNPFNPSTTIKFGIPRESRVLLVIYNILGQQVVQLVNKQLKVGYHTIDFDGTEFSSGIYFYRLKTDEFVETKKMILLK